MDLIGGAARLPLVRLDVPADVPVAKALERVDQIATVGSAAEWRAEPRPRIMTGDASDYLLRAAHIGGQAVTVQDGQPGVVEGVVADQMPGIGDRARQLRECLCPAPLDEERGTRPGIGQRRQDLGRGIAVVRAIRVLGVEGERHPHRRCHFSTPVITMPRMKNRCARKKTIMGMTMVISVPAWTSSADWLRWLLKFASPVAIGCRSGSDER